jgi:hypothetical protein
LHNFLTVLNSTKITFTRTKTRGVEKKTFYEVFSYIFKKSYSIILPPGSGSVFGIPLRIRIRNPNIYYYEYFPTCPPDRALLSKLTISS